MNNIIEYLKKHAQESPSATAFVIPGSDIDIEKEISFSDLFYKINSLSGQLINEGLSGEKVILVYQDVTAFIICFLACQQAGIIPVPVPYIRGRRDFSRILPVINDVQAKTILCQENAITHLGECLLIHPETAHIKLIVTDVVAVSQELTTRQESCYNKISFIQYTSGSTGNPKGVVVTSESLLHNQQLLKNVFGCNSNSVILSWLPFHHDMGLIGNILHAVYTGCTCILLSPLMVMQAPVRWLRAISAYGVTHSGGPNFAYDYCVDSISPEELSGLDLSGWKVAYNGSEPVRASTIERFSERFSTAGFDPNAFFPCYGLAEATLLVSGQKTNNAPIKIFTDNDNKNATQIVSSGAVPDGVHLKVISDNGTACIELEKGEICIAGESVTSGYWNRDNTPFYCEVDGQLFLKTGDRGFLYRNELFVCGRIKEMLIVRGRNFFPSDIEELIAQSHVDIITNGVAIFSIQETDDKLVVAAEVKRSALKNMNAGEIIMAIENALAGVYGINAYDILLTTPLKIPRTTSGKIQRLKCRSYYQDNNFNVIMSKKGLQTASLRIRNEELLAEVIREPDYDTIKAYLLDIIHYKLGSLQGQLPNDGASLTELGIDSIRLMELINIINSDMDINMDVTIVFQNNTLSGFINNLGNILWLKNAHTSGEEIII